MIRTEIIEKTLLITFKTDQKNSINPEFSIEFHKLIKEIDCSKFKSIIATSEGEFFSNGLNPLYLANKDADSIRNFMGEVLRLLLSWFRLEIPTIAMIQGHSMGWGTIFSLFCDFRFMADQKIRIGLPESNIGLSVPLAPIYLLEDLVGYKKARDLAYLGTALKPKEALECSLIDQIVTPKKLKDATLKFAHRLAKIPKASLSGNKVSLRHKYRNLMPRLIEEDIQTSPEIILHPEGQKGLIALAKGKRAKFE